jgi:hypothetical protein
MSREKSISPEIISPFYLKNRGIEIYAKNISAGLRDTCENNKTHT